MATQQNFSIRKGRSGTITVSVTGVSDWTDIEAVLVAALRSEDTLAMELTGSIDEANNVITFDYTFDDTDNLQASKYQYEVILYKSNKSYVKTVLYGVMTVVGVVKVDPTE